MSTNRPSAIAWLAGALVLATAAPVRADEVPVPVPVQAEMLAMIASQDHNLAQRSRGQVLTLVVTNPSAESALAAAQFSAALRARPKLAGLPHAVRVVPFTSGPALAAACREERVSIVYLTPGFTGDQVAGLARALEGADVLTVAAVPAYVKKGMVLGFDQVAGRTQLLANLAQGARQNVSFGADLLVLVRKPK